MKKVLFSFFLLTSMAYGATKYIEKPSNVWVENVHYDSDTNTIVVFVHAKFLFISINKTYGIKVKKNDNMENIVEETIGQNPVIVELEKAK